MDETTEAPLEDKPKKKRVYKRKYTRKPKPPVVVNDAEEKAEPEAPVTDRDGMEAIVEPEAVCEDLEAAVAEDVKLTEPAPKGEADAIVMTSVAPRQFRVPRQEKKTRKVWGDGAILMSSSRRRG